MAPLQRLHHRLDVLRRLAAERAPAADLVGPGGAHPDERDENREPLISLWLIPPLCWFFSGWRYLPLPRDANISFLYRGGITL